MKAASIQITNDNSCHIPSLYVLEAALWISLPELASECPELADEIWNLLDSVQKFQLSSN